VSVTVAAVRLRIKKYTKRWVPILGLESWGLTVQFDEAKDLANCTVRPGYEEAVLKFNVERIRRELPDTSYAYEELACHELVHCVLPRSSEREVSRITRSLLRARDGVA
jgi:hypothetical protein